MGFPAFLDTNVLYGAVLNDTLLRIAEAGAFRPYWSSDVLEELQRNLIKHAGLTEEQARRRVVQMDEAFPQARVTGYAGLVDGLACHPKDRHVLAAAILAGCQVIVTFNVKDFPEESVLDSGISVVPPQEFLLDQLDLHPNLVRTALLAQVRASRRPELSFRQLARRLRGAGVGDFVDEVQHRFGADGLDLGPTARRGRVD